MVSQRSIPALGSLCISASDHTQVVPIRPKHLIAAAVRRTKIRPSPSTATPFGRASDPAAFARLAKSRMNSPFGDSFTTRPLRVSTT
jgi:hypothetical protein